MKNLYYNILLVVLSFCFSCKKYLDKNPDSLLGYADNLDNLQALLDNPIYMNEGTPIYPEGSSDDYFCPEDIASRLGGRDLQTYIWDGLSYEQTQNDWYLGYGPIYIANVCLEGIKKIPRSNFNEAQWNNVKGSALFLRGYYFLHLTWTFAKAYDDVTSASDLGIVLRMTSDINEPSVRATAKASYEQVINDVKQAADYLPDNPVHPLRPSKAAAYGLLARAYLSMRDYSNALKYADLSLKIKNDLINFNGDQDIISNLSGIVPPFRQFNKETIFYSESSRILDVCKYYYARIDTSVIKQFNDNDLRKDAYFINSGPYKQFKGTYTQNIIVLYSGISTDEMFITRAECYARIGNKDSALADLNRLLKSRWKNSEFKEINTTTAADALIIILKERRKELLMRGLRWMDIKRQNKEGANIVLKRRITETDYILPPNDNRYALPLPTDIINLTGMPQNPR
jgi:starch-binding outer membrane protein, SusD/RagB family